MKYVYAFLAAIITIAFIAVLNIQLPVGNSKTPRLGYFLSPQQGFWQNAESETTDFGGEMVLTGLKGKADVYFDNRLVPHIYAENDADAYFLQGYLHAKFRLFQMEFETNVAGGRLSELIGKDGLAIDKYFRRLGMVYAAENSLKVMEADPAVKSAMDAYTAGVNAYIAQLKPNQIPLEFKLLNVKPEPWTNMRSALFLKFMSYDLTGQGDDDLLMTNTKNLLGYNLFQKLFPDRADSLDPILPIGTKFEKPSIVPTIPINVDAVYYGISGGNTTAIPPVIPNKNNGSNNWAVSGSKTKSGRPILCNDPHLGLNLPSLWYELQINTPTQNTYGATFPGAPCVIIGFNDSCAWGVTNAGRDVKDFYEMKFKDSTMQEYWFNNEWKKAELRKEVIKVKDGPDDVETLAMTVFGPVMYDKSYQSKNKDGHYYAVRWKAHDGSNELAAFYHLNRAKNYNDYSYAVNYFVCPGQNFAFACKHGDIAIKQQGAFIAKWKHQGEFVMPGTDSSYMWQGVIPNKENPLLYNPPRGFVSSANQMAVDTTYPYYLGRSGNFPIYRGIIINRFLAGMNNITPEDMMKMQTNNYNVFAEMAMPALFKYLDETKLTRVEKRYMDKLKDWNLVSDYDAAAPTIFECFWDSVFVNTYADELNGTGLPYMWPEQSTLVEAMIKDSNYIFADDIRTKDVKEDMHAIVQNACKQACAALENLEKEGKLNWGKYKDTHIGHLLKIPALSRLHVPIGGGANIINATTSNHGPSWRMIVHLTDKTEAYGVYPGGQSGNPGSKYYDNFIDTWAAGKYYPLLFLTKEMAAASTEMKWHLHFKNG